MNLFTYKITRDYGFAPNPYFGYCTLATCKPKIRNACNIGDWIIGFGGLNTIVPNKLVYLMQVNEKMSFDEYWDDQRFQNKKPDFNKNLKYCYGDNIYHKDESGNWLQENSHHSLNDGINYINLNHDTKVNKLIISQNYWYFGENAINICDELSVIIPKNRGHRRFVDPEAEEYITLLLNYINDNKFSNGINGLPFSWKGKKTFTRYKGEN